jgi:hypothetical protein
MKSKLSERLYPKEDAMRVGCKVGWLYYKDYKVAEKASKIAAYNADIQAARGFEFGYCSPGSIKSPRTNMTGEWEKYNGMWEVCIP